MRHPKEANAREEQLAQKFYEHMRADLNNRGICPNRGMLIALKVAAIMARNIAPDKRHEMEPQLHDVLDLELSHNPSE